jgi:hypothetical protein
MTMDRILPVWFLAVSVLAIAASASAQSPPRHAGLVMSVERAAGTIVVADMGPRLQTGDSKVTPHTIRVTPSTQFVRVKRMAGTAPSGWVGDYVERTLPPWDVKTGDWVSATVDGGGGAATAVKIVVVDMTEP